MHKIKEFLMKELESIDKKGQLSMSDLDKVHKMTDTIKNIDKIEKIILIIKLVKPNSSIPFLLEKKLLSFC